MSGNFAIKGGGGRTPNGKCHLKFPFWFFDSLPYWSIFPQDGVVGAHIGMLLSQSRQLADIIKTVPHSTDPIQVSIEGNRTIITCYVYFISFVCYFLVFSSRLCWQGRVSKLSLLPKSWSALDHVSLMRYIVPMNWLFEIIWMIDIGTIWIIDIWM